MSNFTIVDFAAETKANPYTEAVKALIEAGEGKALTITVPRGAKRDGTPGDGGADRLKFQQAANEQGHTARVRKTEDAGDGNVSITFTLTAKHNRGPRKPVETAETAETADTDKEPLDSVFGRKGRRNQ